MISKFKYGAYVTAAITLVFTFLLILSLSIYLFGIDIPVVAYLILNIYFIFVWIWLALGELRTKVIRLNIGFDNFAVSGFFGFGPAKTYYFNDIEGYKTSILPARRAAYEYLYIIAGGKKVIKLSQFYHKNYEELKDYISSLKIKDLGYEQFNYGRELKEIFN